MQETPVRFLGREDLLENGLATHSSILGLYLKWITNKDLLYRTGNFTQSYVAALMGGVFEGSWLQVYVELSPFGVLLKLSQCC